MIMLVFLVCCANAIYIPGIIPHEFSVADYLSMQWSSHLTSSGKHHVVNTDSGP
jgi:hypothetical protein